MKLLQVDSLETNVVEQTTSTAQALLNGDTTQLEALAEQCVAYAVEAGKCIIVAVLIYIVGKFIINLINSLLAKMLSRKNIDASIQSFLKSFVNIVLTILLIVTVVSALGVNTTSFAALLASVGLAFGMALSGNLQNFAGGLLILLFKPFRVGDFIEAQGATGVVKEIQIFHTIITTVDNKLIYLHNGGLSSGSVINYSQDFRRVDLVFGVEYGNDIETVKAAIKEVIDANNLILQDAGHEPFIGLSSLSDSSVDFTVRCWAKGADYWTVFFYMNETVYSTFNKKGIGFPFPQVTVHQAKD